MIERELQYICTCTGKKMHQSAKPNMHACHQFLPLASLLSAQKAGESRQTSFPGSPTSTCENKFFLFIFTSARGGSLGTRLHVDVSWQQDYYMYAAFKPDPLQIERTRTRPDDPRMEWRRCIQQVHSWALTRWNRCRRLGHSLSPIHRAALYTQRNTRVGEHHTTLWDIVPGQWHMTLCIQRLQWQ
jgi:hypothetical protein